MSDQLTMSVGPAHATAIGIAGHAHRCTECNPDPPTTPERGVTMQAPVFVADRKAEGR